MGIRSGRQFLGPLRDGRQMWIDGELVEDVTRDLRFAAAAHTIHASRNAVVDRPDDVSADVRAHVRDHSHAWRDWSRFPPMLNCPVRSVPM
jgi:aromatic ring hydroxylase